MKAEDWSTTDEWELLSLSYNVAHRLSVYLIEVTTVAVDEQFGQYAGDWMYDRVAELAIEHLKTAIDADNK